MDSSFHHHHHQQQQQQGPPWFPLPSSSSPPVGFNQQQPILPPQNHHRLPPHHHHQQQQHMMMGMPPQGPPYSYRGHPPQVPPPAPPYPSPGSLHTLPYRPPPLPHHLQPPHPPAYPPSGQTWGTTSWSQHAGWEYPERGMAYNNEEDWAARARAWAAAKSVTDNHHAQPQFMPVGVVEDHHGYHDQYKLAVGTPSEAKPPSIANSSDHQHLSGRFLDLQKRENQMYGSTSFGLASTSYAMEGHVAYNTGAEAIVTDAHHIVSPCQRSYGATSSIYEQEVSYTYSSAPGNTDILDHNEGHHKLEASSCARPHSTALPVHSFSMQQPQFTNEGQRTKSVADTTDEPLNFESRPASERDSHKHFAYRSTDAIAPSGMGDRDRIVTSLHSWTPAGTPGIAFSQIPSVLSQTQFDTSFLAQPSIPLHSAPVFGRIPGPNFGPSIPPVAAPFVPASGASLHHPTIFPADATGPPNAPDRPKKAAVPNWLREEIIKKKSIVASTVEDHASGDSLRFSGSENADIFSRKPEQADSKSIDSTRSTEEDEDDVEATKGAAINQEIKRVLTEVLLKVTDELFDEIAMKVLSEDDLTIEVNENSLHGKHKISPPPSVPTRKVSAPVPLTVKMEDKNRDGSSKTSSPGSPGGDLLGLADYASDNDDEPEASTVLSSGIIADAFQKQPNNGRFAEIKFEKGNNFFNNEESNRDKHDIESRRDTKSINGPLQDPNLPHGHGDLIAKSVSSVLDDSYLRENASQGIAGDDIAIHKAKVIEFPSAVEKNAVTEKKNGELEYKSDFHTYRKPVVLERQSKESKSTLDTQRDLNKMSDSKGSVQDAKLVMEKVDHENDNAGDLVIHEERNRMKVVKDEKDSMKEGAQERRVKQGSMMRVSDLRSTSKHDNMENEKKDNTREKSDRRKEDSERRKERTKAEKVDHPSRSSKDFGRYNSKRSLSPISRGKSSKENSLSGRGSVSSDEPSENAKRRKLQSYKRSSPPSPARFKKRQDSRSPHSKHSHRRNSPFSSTMERRRRSRSRTPPVHRRSSHRH